MAHRLTRAAAPPRPPASPFAWASKAVRFLVRPSFRLKTVLLTLVLGIAALVVLAINVAHTDVDTIVIGGKPIGGKPLPVDRKPTPSGVPDPPKRSFEEPNFALLSAKPPHQIGCDVPLNGTNAGPLVFIGVFSTMSEKAERRRRIFREQLFPDFPSDLFTIRFIVGIPPMPPRDIPSKERKEKLAEREENIAKVEAEIEEHKDIVVLPIKENIDHGKTHEFFKWIAREYDGPGQVKGRPRFVMKADDDTLLVAPNVISNFINLDCSKNIYWGTSAGRSRHFNDYFRGLAYALSWPLVSWIGNADMAPAHVLKIEDARTGQWLRSLDPAVDPVTRIDLGWSMGDWNQLDITIATVALHWIKHDGWINLRREQVLDAWEEEGIEFNRYNGVLPYYSIKKGKVVPKAAKEEYERQREKGWENPAMNVQEVY